MYKIAICDDDKKYVDFLEQIICQVSEKPQDNIIYKFYSGEEFLENPASSFDLLFLDMKMEKVDGMAAALKYRESDQDGILRVLQRHSNAKTRILRCSSVSLFNEVIFQRKTDL